MSLRNILVSFFLLAASGVVYVLGLHYSSNDLFKFSIVIFLAGVLYFLLKVILQRISGNLVKDSKTSYGVRKVITALYFASLVLIGLIIFVPNPQVLLISFGVVLAGLTLDLQDVLRNIAGGIVLTSNGLYSVGDRIEINGKHGDVIDVDLLYTTFLELREWVEADQSTGRLTFIPNSWVLTYGVSNYTKDHAYIWDEILVPISHDSDWKKADAIMTSAAKKASKNFIEDAQKQTIGLDSKYYDASRNSDPAVFASLTSNSIDLRLRYIVPAKKRRVLHDEITRTILNEFKKVGTISMSSNAIIVTGFPEKKSIKSF